MAAGAVSWQNPRAMTQKAAFGAAREERQPVTVGEDRLAFGRMLRYWRGVRGESQLSLSLEADVSARHISFIESGRSRPSQEMILRLARILRVPFRDQNLLLEAGGFAHRFRDTGLSNPELAHARRAILLILERQEPFPAIVMDRAWNLVHANDAASRFFARLLGEGDPTATPNVLRLVFSEDGLKPFLVNWDEVARALLDRVVRESVSGALDEETRALIDEVTSYPGVPRQLRYDVPRPPGPLIALHFRHDGLDQRFFSTVTTLGTPCDITLQELRVECFFPADAETEASVIQGEQTG